MHSGSTDPTAPVASEQLRAFLAEAEAFDGNPPVSDQALLGVTHGRRTLLNFGDAIGIIGEGEVDVVVRPATRNRGIGRRVLQQLLRYQGDHAARTELRAWAHGNNQAAEKLLTEAGFTPTRELLRMSLSPDLLPRALQTARPWPTDLALTGFQHGNDAQANDWVRVNAAAFAEHPEQGSLTRADFDSLQQEPWFAADDLRLAYLQRQAAVPSAATPPPQLVGFAWIKTTTAATTVEAELYVLAVHPNFAGNGFGAALMGEALRRIATHRPHRIVLYVDSSNVHAIDLYARANFEVEQRSKQFTLQLNAIA